MYKLPEQENNLAEESLGKYNLEKDFTSLQAWQNARLVKLFFYNRIMPILPSEEKYNLVFQIRKAAVSVTANISEGYGRFYYQEGIQFYRIARGSLYELRDHLTTCMDLAFIDTKLFGQGIALIEDAKMILNGYIKFVKSQKEKDVR